MRSPPEFEPAAILDSLVRQRVDFVLIGGLAGLAHQAGWVTFDVDVVVQNDEANLDRLLAALTELGAQYDTFHQPPLLPDARLVRSGSGPQLFRTRYGRLDVLKEAGGETFESLIEDAIELEQHGQRVTCASLEALLRMKRAANRPKDQPAIAKIEARLRERDE
ncbi:MAG: hypothetical protein KC619_24295 [Myxococcales bacterium]|nr:hypothetical protein [Myxococcales bacterium]